MKSSDLLIPTVKEAPNDAKIISHQLMIRAGLISKLASGLYSYLPIGLRVVQKVEKIIREEMNKSLASDLFISSRMIFSTFCTTRRPIGRYEYKPEASFEINPARIIN